MLIRFLRSSVAALRHLQRWRKRRRRFFVGLLLVGGLAGVHLGGPVALAFQYHPNNEFGTGDAIGLGFGSDDAVYGQTGIAEYFNHDSHTFVGQARLYVLGPLYVGLGGAHQTGSTRSVTFDRADRRIGDTVYRDLELTIETTLQDQTAPIASGGVHPVFGGIVGFMTDANFGLANTKQLAEMQIIANQTLAPEDEAALAEAVRADAESEGFGIATAGPTLGLPLAGMGGVVPWSIGGWLWRRRRSASAQVSVYAGTEACHRSGQNGDVVILQA